jgi:hypothetical protein
MTYSPAIQNILEESCLILNEKFEEGSKLESTRSFSGPALEHWCSLTIKLIIADLKEKYPNAQIEWGKGYIKSDHGGFSDERLDQHVTVNGKYVYLQEDRAWSDKPFYTLKRAVIRNIMISCASKLSSNVKYGIIGYSIDIKPEIIATCDYCQGYGDRIELFSLTGRKRNKKVNGKAVNWYQTGYNEETVAKYIEYVYKILEDAILA